MGGRVRYEVVKDHGALLALQDCGHGEMAQRTGEWPDYIARNHGEWYRWASQNVERDIKKEDIEPRIEKDHANTPKEHMLL